MRAVERVLTAAVVAASLAVAARAEVVLEGVHWQASRVENRRAAAWQDVKVLFGGPPKLGKRLRARLVLKNRGSKIEEGLLIRFSMTARIVPVSAAGTEGSWAIPFVVEAKRVPKVAAEKMIDVYLETGAPLEIYLRHLARLGFWPDRVKLQAMLEPHPGSASVQTVEDMLEVRGTSRGGPR